MASYNHSHFNCNNTVTQLFNQSSSSLPDDLQNLMHFCVMGYESQVNEKFSKPLVWIGVYIAIASLFHLVAMVADSINIFSFNAASLTVLSIAMKLPLDMTGSMPGVVDQVAKLGSLAFMCTIMANLIPSLAFMDNKDLVANIIGLAILVITIIAMMLLLLLVSISTAIIIPLTKKILEFNYQERRNTLSEEKQRTTLSEEELRGNVTRYWIMAKSGSPLFIMAGTYLAYTSTLICVINAGLFCALYFRTLHGDIRSDYGLAMRSIYVIQFDGIIIGTLALVYRFIRSLSYRKSPEGFSVSSLSEWKRSCIAFLSSGRRTRTFVQRMNYFIISLCIEFHTAVLALFRIPGSMFEYFYVTFVQNDDDDEGEENDDRNLLELYKMYVLYIEDSLEISLRALKCLLNSMESLIQKAEKQRNGNLLELLQMSGLFNEGAHRVNNFDIYHVPDLPSKKLNSWSLPVVTLICIAIHIPGISKDKIVKLIDAVDEALHFVEESFKRANKHENLLNTAMTTVWYEVKENPNWFLNPMQICPHWEKKKPREILNWFKDRGNSVSQNRIPDAATTTYFQHFPDYTVIAAHSMQHISNQILLRYDDTIDGCTSDQFFDFLCTMIADILCASMTNIPQVIMRKCHSDAIEKREASVEAAVELLGRTTDIREFLNGHASRLPRCMDLTSIDWWHTHFGDHV